MTGGGNMALGGVTVAVVGHGVCAGEQRGTDRQAL